MKTFSAKEQDVKPKWWVIDADNKVLGKVAVAAANLLRGKNKPIFTPHARTGDYVIVINAEKVRLTGKKETQKEYVSFSGYVGGKKVRTPEQLRQKHPELIVEHAVKGMIPKNRLGRSLHPRLKVCTGGSHPFADKAPAPYAIA